MKRVPGSSARNVLSVAIDGALSYVEVPKKADRAALLNAFRDASIRMEQLLIGNDLPGPLKTRQGEIVGEVVVHEVRHDG